MKSVLIKVKDHTFTKGPITLFVNNSGYLNPDWLYAALKYEHPALIERLEGIEKYMAKVVKDKNLG